MKEAILFDNSVISRYCTITQSTESQKLDLLQDVLKKFNLALEDTLITDHQYLEASGKGKIRAEIVKEFKTQIDAAKPSISTDIQNTTKLLCYISFLENLFSIEFRKRLPRWKIYDFIQVKHKKHPLHSSLSLIKKKLHNHGSSLFKYPVEYETFINLLVEDSVTRYALAFINFKEIPKTQHDKGMKLLEVMISLLKIKYASSQILQKNLNLLASALRTAIKAKTHSENPFKPMFRIEDDIADIELTHFMLYGTTIGKQRVPVTVITNEPKTTVIERINYDVVTSSKVKTSHFGPQVLLLGRIILLDFDNFTHDVITGEYLRDNFKTLGGAPLF